MSTTSSHTHILVIRLSSMGDVAMTVPILRAFVLQYPNVKLTVVTRYFFAPFFKDLPNTTIFTPDLEGKHKGILGLYRLSKALKPLACDSVADLHNVLRTKFITLFLGKKTAVINKGRARKKALVKGKFKPLKTTHQRYADVFEALGFPLNLNTPTFPVSKALNNNCLEFMNLNRGVHYVGIAPFAFYPSKMYPLTKMEVVIKELSKDYKIILFGGGTKESTLLAKLAERYNNVVSIAGKLTLDEELAIVSNLDVMLAMDSANAHLAAMFGVDVITIWGVTHPYAGFSAFNQPTSHQLTADRVQYPKIPTSIYGNRYPKGYEEAAGSIPVESIVQKVKEVLL